MQLKRDHFLGNYLIYCTYITDEDEEGDRITVRGDEELQAMINGVGHSFDCIPTVLSYTCICKYILCKNFQVRTGLNINFFFLFVCDELVNSKLALNNHKMYKVRARLSVYPLFSIIKLNMFY